MDSAFVRAFAALCCFSIVVSLAAAPASPGSTSTLTLMTSYRAVHGNAAHLAWSDDGTSLFLADEEGIMSAIRLDVSTPSAPVIAATSQVGNFLWAVSQKSGLLVYRPSLGIGTIRLDPSSWAMVWKTKKTGTGHTVQTDGTRVYAPVESFPGVLQTLDSNGNLVASTQAPDGWKGVYGSAYDAGTRRLYVASNADAGKGIPGGVYVFDVSKAAPAYLGRIATLTAGMAVSGTRLWTTHSNVLTAWDVTNPAAAVAVGRWTGATVAGPGGVKVKPAFGGVAVNAAGTRLYAAYSSVVAVTGETVGNWNAGFMIFDVSKAAPVSLAANGLTTASFVGGSGTWWETPTAVALSPAGTTLAVSFWSYGVALYNVAGDATALLGSVATAGEAHDVYVDAAGIVYIFDNDLLYAITPTTGAVTATPYAGQVDGGWKPFRDGRVTLAGGVQLRVAGFSGGGVTFWQTFALGAAVWDNAFDGTYLYSGCDDGTVRINLVAYNGATYTLTQVGQVAIPKARGGKGSAAVLAVALNGTMLWALGPNLGLAAVDVSAPASPLLVYHDSFTFTTNGNHIGMVAAQNRVYAGAGSAGVRIYNPATFTRTGSLTGLDVNFLDVAMDTGGTTFLVVANYLYASLPDGTYLYNITATPDAPLLAAVSTTGANFRSRVLGGFIYRVPLYGAAVLQIP